MGVSFEKIKTAGGQIIQEKTMISNKHGYYGKFKDTCGNIMGLWSSS